MKKVLYLGVSPSHFISEDEVIHYPVIRLIPKNIQDERVLFCLNQLEKFSFCLLTSKNSVEILWDLCSQLSLSPEVCLRSKCISIGSITSSALRAKGVEPCLQALEATQEGLISCLQEKLAPDSYVFYPRSSLARPLLSNYLLSKGILHQVLDLYDTVYQALDPKPCLEEISEIVFTSPSTVDGFFKIFAKIPKNIKLSFQGPITKKKFHEKCRSLLINF